MTRWARGGPANKKKPHEATEWKCMSSDRTQQQQQQQQHKQMQPHKNVSGSDAPIADKSKKKHSSNIGDNDRKRNMLHAQCDAAVDVGHHSNSSAAMTGSASVTLKHKKHKREKGLTTELADVRYDADVVVGRPPAEADKVSTHRPAIDVQTAKFAPPHRVPRENDRVSSETLKLAEFVRKDQRREARRRNRQQKKQNQRVCFNCRQPGHDLSACPEVKNDTDHGTGICFKCGSTEHTLAECKLKLAPGNFPFAKCFICGEIGHLSRKCPDNPRGLYPNGGSCKLCDSVEHFMKDCPEHLKEQGIQDVRLPTVSKCRSMDEDMTIAQHMTNTKPPAAKKPKVVKF